MSQNDIQPSDGEPALIEVARNPTPDAEGGFFASPDDKRQAMLNKHQLDVHDRNLGLIGKITGSTDPSLNIASVIAGGLIVALFLCLGGAVFHGLDKLGPYIERLITGILTVGGFIFGVRQGGSEK